MVAVQNSVRDLGSSELWEASRARSTRRRESYRRRRQVRRMSVPLVMAATAAGMGAPAYAAGKEHQASAKAGARRVLPRILRVGDTGPDVVKLQRQLGVAADGIFGRHTLHAVKLFQGSHGLLVDGQVGPHTRAALAAAGAGNDGWERDRHPPARPGAGRRRAAAGARRHRRRRLRADHAARGQGLPGRPRAAGGRAGGAAHAGRAAPRRQRRLHLRAALRRRHAQQASPDAPPPSPPSSPGPPREQPRRPRGRSGQARAGRALSCGAARARPASTARV